MIATGNGKGSIRSLVIFAARPHDNIGWRSLGSERSVVCLISISCFLEESHEVIRNPAKVAPAVGGYNTKKTLTRLLGEVGLLEDALRGVDVR